MSQRILVRKHDDSKLPDNISPDFAKTYIRITGDKNTLGDHPYFEGTIRAFIFEKRPLPQLIDMLTRLNEQTSYAYRLGTETITVERIDNPEILPGRYRFGSRG